MPVGARDLRRGAAHGRRGLPHPQGRAQEEGLQHRRRRRGRLRPQPQVQRGGRRSHPRGHQEGRLQARQGHRHRPRPRRQRVLRHGEEASTSSRSPTSREKTADADGRVLRGLGQPVSHRLARGRPGRGRLGRLEEAHRARSATRSSSSATTSSSPTPSSSQQGIEQRRRQLHPHQGQPDRHAHRDPRRHRAGHAARLHRRHLATAPARPRTPPSPTSPWPPTPARSRPARPAAPTASASTTSCCASRKSWARAPSSWASSR